MTSRLKKVKQELRASLKELEAACPGTPTPSVGTVDYYMGKKAGIQHALLVVQVEEHLGDEKKCVQRTPSGSRIDGTDRVGEG